MTNSAYNGRKNNKKPAGAQNAGNVRRPSARHQVQRTTGRGDNTSYIKRAASSSEVAENTKVDHALEAEESAEKSKKGKRKRKRSVTKLVTIMSDRKYSFPVSIVVVALSFTFLVLAIVTASVRVNDISVDISSLKTQINKANATVSDLSVQLGRRDDLRQVENLARNEYGMVEADQVERYYLTTENSDRIEIIEEVREERQSVFSRIPEFFDSAIKRIRKTFGW